MLRKAQTAISMLGTPGHGELVSLLYSEKAVGETFSKLATNEKEACQALAKWSGGEENATLRDLVTRVTELHELRQTIWSGFCEEYDTYRKLFKEILRGEKMLDDARKDVDNLRSKVVKLAKQLEAAQMKKKVDTAKLEALDAEYAKAISAHDEGVKDMKLREENHASFKYAKVREALYLLTRAGSSLHERSSQIIDAQEKLLQIYPKTMSKTTMETYKQAQTQGKQAVDDLAGKLELTPPAREPDQSAKPPAPAKPMRSPSSTEALVAATSPGAVTISEPKPATPEDTYTYQPIPDRDGDVYDNTFTPPSPAPAIVAPPSRTSSTKSEAEDANKLAATPQDEKASPNSVRRPLPPLPKPADAKGYARQVSDMTGNMYDTVYADPVKTVPQRPPNSPAAKINPPSYDEATSPTTAKSSDHDRAESSEKQPAPTTDTTAQADEYIDEEDLLAIYDRPDAMTLQAEDNKQAKVKREK